MIEKSTPVEGLRSPPPPSLHPQSSPPGTTTLTLAVPDVACLGGALILARYMAFLADPASLFLSPPSCFGHSITVFGSFINDC